MSGTQPLQILPLELGDFRFRDPDLADHRGVVMGYAIRHVAGVLLFDTGFGFGNAEIDETYQPNSRRIAEALADAGIPIDELTSVVNCHLHADHAGQNSAFPGIPIYVQPSEWAAAHTPEHTILEWIDFAGGQYEQVAGDHDLLDGIRVIATPGHTVGHQSLLVQTSEGPTVIAGQACYSVGEWVGDADALEGRSSAPDKRAYDASIERLRGLNPVRVFFGHDRLAWTPLVAP